MDMEIMSMSETVSEIFTAISKVQEHELSVTKDKDNPITHSKYATLDAIQRVLYPITSSLGLAVIQFPINSDNKIGVGMIVGHSSGEWIKFRPYMLTVSGNKRMSDAQEEGSTITYAKRYQLSAIFGISSDEDVDGNAANQSVPQKKRNSNKPTKSNPQQRDKVLPINDKQKASLDELFDSMAQITGKPIIEVKQGYLNLISADSVDALNNHIADKLIEIVSSQLIKQQDIKKENETKGESVNA